MFTMDFLHKTCSICLSKDKKLKNLFNFDHDGINFYSKLTAAFNNMCLKKYNKQRHICEECSVTLDIVYNFWKKCVESRTTLQNYISQLNVDGIEESNDCVSDVNNYIKVSRIKPSKTNKVKVISSNINTIEDNLDVNFTQNNTNTINNQIYVEFNQLEVKTEPDFQGGNNTVNSTSGNIIVKTEPRCHDDDISLTPTNEIVDQIEVKTERINDDEISDSNLTNSLNCVDVFHEKKTSFEEIHIKTEIEDEDFVGCSETSIEIKDEIDIDENNWVSDGKKKELNSLKSDEQQDIKATDDQNSSSTTNPKKSSKNDLPYSCETCNKSFRYKSILKAHSRRHLNLKPFSCNLCPSTFSVKGSLMIHLKKHTGEKPFKCEICDKEFSVKSILTNHLKIHSGERPYACTVCEKRFSERGSLNIHTRIHTGEMPYECTICSKQFRVRCSLTAHMGRHSGAQEHRCTLCSSLLGTRSDLLRHMRLHTGERPHQCTVCEKRFSDRTKLAQHTRSHTGERPYQCAQCDGRFTSSTHLARHARSHSGARPYQCTVCDWSSRERAHLKAHMKTHERKKKKNSEKEGADGAQLIKQEIKSEFS